MISSVRNVIRSIGTSCDDDVGLNTDKITTQNRPVAWLLRAGPSSVA
jgi:hypothetical protein